MIHAGNAYQYNAHWHGINCHYDRELKTQIEINDTHTQEIISIVFDNKGNHCDLVSKSSYNHDDSNYYKEDCKLNHQLQ